MNDVHELFISILHHWIRLQWHQSRLGTEQCTHLWRCHACVIVTASKGGVVVVCGDFWLQRNKVVLFKNAERGCCPWPICTGRKQPLSKELLNMHIGSFTATETQWNGMDSIIVDDGEVVDVRCFGQIAHVSSFVAKLNDEPNIFKGRSCPE